jgi:hypothetical protein
MAVFLMHFTAAVADMMAHLAAMISTHLCERTPEQLQFVKTRLTRNALGASLKYPRFTSVLVR